MHLAGYTDHFINSMYFVYFSLSLILSTKPNPQPNHFRLGTTAPTPAFHEKRRESLFLFLLKLPQLQLIHHYGRLRRFTFRDW